MWLSLKSCGASGCTNAHTLQASPYDSLPPTAAIIDYTAENGGMFVRNNSNGGMFVRDNSNGGMFVRDNSNGSMFVRDNSNFISR